jgi:hypothetical protein
MTPSRRVISVIGAAVLAGCASQTAPIHPDSTYLGRAVARARGGIAVTASVLDQSEIGDVFGARLDLVGIQPVWLKIQNLSAYSYVLFLKSIDPDYFSPYEVARRSSTISTRSVQDLYPFVRDREIDRFITPGEEVEGHVYTHLDEGIKVVNVDLVGNRQKQSFNMAIEVPGLQTDYDDVDARFGKSTVPSMGESELRAWLEALPCCTQSAEGVDGDPVNLVLVGELDAIRTALVGQHWDVTAEITSSSIRRMISAFIFGSRFRYAPVSPLYLFGREQDMSFQKARAVIDERNHIRLWHAPVVYQGAPVWVGHISRDAGIKFSGRFWPPTTHVIDPAVDEARFYLEQDIIDSHKVQKFGLVGGVGAAAEDQPRFNAEGDPYFTDGHRAVFLIGEKFVPIERIEVLNWRLPAEMEPYRENIFAGSVESE